MTIKKIIYHVLSSGWSEGYGVKFYNYLRDTYPRASFHYAYVLWTARRWEAEHQRAMEPGVEWGYFDAEGAWNRVQKKPIELAGVTPPCYVMRPDGLEVLIMGRPEN